MIVIISHFKLTINKRLQVPTLLNAIFWPSHEISHLTGHHTTIDCINFLMSGYLLQLVQCSREYTPDFR